MRPWFRSEKKAEPQNCFFNKKAIASPQQLNTPPVLVVEDGYCELLNDGKIWQFFTDLVKKKEGPALYLT